MQKFQGRQSVGSEDRVDTNGQTDGRTEAIALSAALLRSVNISSVTLPETFGAYSHNTWST